MTPAQTMLVDMLKTKGKVTGDIVKVDTFLNHQVDIRLLKAIGQEIAGHFKDKKIDKIITVEASGIVIAQAAAFYLDCDYIYAKKKRPLTMEGYYMASSFSFTKQEETSLFVSKEVLEKGDRVLFVDDFYARGHTLRAMETLIEEAGAVLAGKAVAIDKQGRDDVFSILTLCEIKKLFGL